MKPDRVFDNMLQHERTALAWERTAISTIVAGAFLTRYVVSVHRALAVVGRISAVSKQQQDSQTGRRSRYARGDLFDNVMDSPG